MNEVETSKRQTLQQAMGEMEFHPVFAEEDVSDTNYTKIPLSRIPALGTALEPLAAAVLNPLVYNPTMIFMAATLANIDKKLDAIQELQQEMMKFLVQKEKTEMKGNLIFLSDILNNFKYNWDSDMYKQSNHVKVLDVRQSSEQKILFYRQQIIEKTKKKNLIHIDKDVKKQMSKLMEHFKDYRLALYTYGFAYFLEIMLLGNFDADYLESISHYEDAC